MNLCVCVCARAQETDRSFKDQIQRIGFFSLQWHKLWNYFSVRQCNTSRKRSKNIPDQSSSLNTNILHTEGLLKNCLLRTLGHPNLPKAWQRSIHTGDLESDLKGITWVSPQLFTPIYSCDAEGNTNPIFSKCTDKTYEGSIILFSLLKPSQAKTSQLFLIQNQPNKSLA